jgi:hypothetical protein
MLSFHRNEWPHRWPSVRRRSDEYVFAHSLCFDISLRNCWRIVCFCLSLSAAGCVTLRQPKSTSNAQRDIACDSTGLHASTADCWAMQSEFDSDSWIEPLRPRNLIPPPLQAIGCQVRERCTELGSLPMAMKAKWSVWLEEKRKAANPPPWPRFHPLPTRPVFSGKEDSIPHPENYGQLPF